MASSNYQPTRVAPRLDPRQSRTKDCGSACFFLRDLCKLQSKNSHAPTGLLRVLLSAKNKKSKRTPRRLCAHEDGRVPGALRGASARSDFLFAGASSSASCPAKNNSATARYGFQPPGLTVLGRVLLPPGLQVLPWMFSPYMQSCDAFGTCLPPGFRKGTFTSRSCHGWFLLVRGILWWQRLEPGIGSLVVLRLGMLPLQ